ncbi:MAG TPA: bifunctional 4-hydroxy-2-oxoglutarate aldolase/2-dehydro-3-deoxy-phosphogluconate aldolase [bacterium]|nr:bifunctional 4-hydroxy-2-oxoglutarate aldolase/2-dehydro-3-deoxy-phosphogluconate aldolase [bacterium]
MSAAVDAREALATILRARVVPIVRTRSTAWAAEVAEILATSGMDVIEITFTVPDAPAVIRSLRDRFPEILIGAGTVTDAATAGAAVEAGAQFLLSPALSPGMVQVARRNGVLAVPGAYTPTEVLAAMDAGAELVKIFPAESGGPAHVRALLGPLPHARLLPTGGVRPDNIREWLAAGAVAVGIGSALVGPADRPVDAAAVRARAEVITAQVAGLPRGGSA